MEDTRNELERIQQGLLADEEEVSIDEILNDAELNALLNERPAAVPAFEDPEKIHDPEEPARYQNFANDYGAPPQEDRKKQKNDRVIVGLMVTACVLCVGIIGILGYWLNVLL